MTTSRPKKKRPLTDVFKLIDMKQGDVTACWPWQGTCTPNPIFYIGTDQRVQAHRLVYALRHGIEYSKVPKLTWTCFNNKCCNPRHLVKQYSIEDQLNREVKLTCSAV